MAPCCHTVGDGDGGPGSGAVNMSSTAGVTSRGPRNGLGAPASRPGAARLRSCRVRPLRRVMPPGSPCLGRGPPGGGAAAVLPTVLRSCPNGSRRHGPWFARAARPANGRPHVQVFGCRTKVRHTTAAAGRSTAPALCRGGPSCTDVPHAVHPPAQQSGNGHLHPLPGLLPIPPHRKPVRPTPPLPSNRA